MRRPHLRHLSALVCLTFCLGGLSGLADAPARSARAQAPTPACTSTVDKTAAPAQVKRGEEVTVQLSISGSCPAQVRKADVVLVIDRSSSMNNLTASGITKISAAKQAARGFVDAMDPALVRVGLIVFSRDVEELSYLTNDQAKLRTAIDRFGTQTGTNLVDSLEAGYRMATSAGVRPDAQPILIFMTDGRHNEGNGSPPESAIFPVIAKVHASGLVVHAIGLGQDSDIDEPMLRQIAGDPSRFHRSASGDDLGAIFQGIAGIIKANVLFKTLTVVDRVPANMSYVLDSAEPKAAWDPAARTLTWSFTAVPDSGHLLRFRVRPQEVGRHPTNVEAVGTFRDGFDNEGSKVFPVPQVTVVEPEVPGLCVCRITRLKAPQSVIDLALANPPSVMGWNLLQNPNKPGSPPFPTPGHDWPPNPRRTCLDIQNRAVPFHPLFNSVIWRAGCLEGPDRP